MKLGNILMIQLIFIVFCLGTWCFNLKHLTNCDFKAPYKAEIIYGAGVFTPSCLVTAWLDLGE